MKRHYPHRWQQFADDLLDVILQSGIETLPGLRALGKKYQVSRVTVERGLQHLVELHFIHPPEHGKSRRVHLENVTTARQAIQNTQRRVLFLVTNHDAIDIRHNCRQIYTFSRELLAKDGILLEYIIIPESLKQLKLSVTSLQPMGLLTYGISAHTIDSLVDTGLRIVGIGCNSKRVIRFNTSYSSLVFTAMQQAWSAGHRLVSCPLWNRSPGVHSELSENLEPHFSEAGKPFSASYHLPEIQGDSPADYHQALDTLFAHTPPTCLIVGNLEQYLMAHCYFVANALRVPDDVSIIVLSDDPHFSYITPTVARFSIDLENCSAQAVLTLLEQIKGARSCDAVEVECVWNAGDSLKLTT